MSLGKKLTACILIAVLITASVAVMFSYYNYSRTMDEHYKTLVSGVGKTAASQLDGDTIAGYINKYTTEGGTSADSLPKFEADNYFYEMYDVLTDICNNMNVKYLYIVSNRGAYCWTLIDTETEREKLSFGNDCRSDNAAEFSEYSHNMPIPATISKTDEGWFCSGYEVVKDSSGDAVAMVGVDIMMDDVMADRAVFLSILIIWMTIATALLLGIFIFIIRRQVIRPINQLSTATSQFVNEKEKNFDGELSAISKLNIRTHDEIEQLCTSVKTMEKDINAYISNLASVTAEKERIGAELDVAKHIQASMLPCIFPAFPERSEFDIYATMTPAKEVGGDFYDFFLTDDDHLAMVMADVSGKGVPAALFMVIAKTLLKNVAQTGLSPKAVLEKVNNQLCINNEAEMFVTVWLGIMEISTGNLICANAGHEYPALKRADGDYELVKDKHGFVLAGMEGSRYKEYELHMEPGDKLFLYTDGVAEATDADNVLYGTDRMLTVLNRCKDKNCEALLHCMKEDIDLFVGEAPQFDDITMLSIERKPQESGMKKIQLIPELTAIDKVTGFVEEELGRAEISMKIITQMNIAVDEIFSNIARYSAATSATVGLQVENGTIILRFADNGRPYDPTEKPDPDISLSAEERDIGGLGIFMVKKFMDRVEYAYHDGLNILTLTKKCL